MTNLRELVGFEDRYLTINREERNLAALFHHALLCGDNLERFLTLVGVSEPAVRERAAVYYEYAFLRDLWDARIGRDEALARRVIDAVVRPGAELDLQRATPREANEFFGVGGKPSERFIQNPARWSISKYRHTIRDNDLFLRATRFKWSFNAKPDIVIELGGTGAAPDRAVCIEAKLESGEGSYPSSAADKAEFDRRGLARVGQTDLQREILEDLVGFDTTFVFLVQKPTARSATHRTLTWREAFAALDVSGSPAFVCEWVGRV
jgi:hypothetical protein